MERLWADPDVSSRYTHLKGPTAAITEALWEIHHHLKRPLDGPSIELEMRLGSLAEDGTYRSDVGKEAFHLLLQKLESYAGWFEVLGWTETQDVFYTIALPQAFDGQDRRAEIRTSVCPNECNEMRLKHTIKRRLKVLDFRACQGFQEEEAGGREVEEDAPRDLGLRFSVCVETPVPSRLLPAAVIPTRVRIKQRKRFLLGSIGMEKPAFSFDLTVVYTGASKSEVERKQASLTGEQYEVEIECLEPFLYLQTCDFQESFLSLSLLLKAYDLLLLLAPQESRVALKLEAAA